VYDDFCLLYSKWEERNEVVVRCKIRVDNIVLLIDTRYQRWLL